jgi:hypothetical protein
MRAAPLLGSLRKFDPVRGETQPGFPLGLTHRLGGQFLTFPCHPAAVFGVAFEHCTQDNARDELSIRS